MLTLQVGTVFKVGTTEYEVKVSRSSDVVFSIVVPEINVVETIEKIMRITKNLWILPESWSRT